MTHKKQLLWQLPFLAFLIAGTVIIVGRQRSMPYQHDKGMVFGTVYHITYQSDKNLKKKSRLNLPRWMLHCHRSTRVQSSLRST